MIKLTEQELYKLICICSHYSYLTKKDLDEIKNKLALMKGEIKKPKAATLDSEE